MHKFILTESMQMRIEERDHKKVSPILIQGGANIQSKHDQHKHDQSKYEPSRYDQSKYEEQKHEPSRYDEPKYDQSKQSKPDHKNDPKIIIKHAKKPPHV